jgi:hypothetical protein
MQICKSNGRKISFLIRFIKDTTLKMQFIRTKPFSIFCELITLLLDKIELVNYHQGYSMNYMKTNRHFERLVLDAEKK